MEQTNSNKQNSPVGVTSLRTRTINWGTGIVIAFVLFIVFILYFVFSVQSNSKYDNELVVEEYYKQDAKFGDEMERLQNAQDLTQKPIITNTAAGITIIFSEVFSAKEISGKVFFYRPSAKKFDFEVPILLSNATMNVPTEKLFGGRWTINMEWEYKGKQYLTKEVVYIDKENFK